LGLEEREAIYVYMIDKGSSCHKNIEHILYFHQRDFPLIIYTCEKSYNTKLRL